MRRGVHAVVLALGWCLAACRTGAGAFPRALERQPDDINFIVQFAKA